MQATKIMNTMNFNVVTHLGQNNEFARQTMSCKQEVLHKLTNYRLSNKPTVSIGWGGDCFDKQALQNDDVLGVI